MDEERELSMSLVANPTKMASQSEIAVAYWGPDEVEKHWDPDGWMRARVRHRLDLAREIESRRGADGR